jgi:hypothetical protein
LQRLGQIPGSGGAARLQKMVGITRAKDIVMRLVDHAPAFHGPAVKRNHSYRTP